MSALNLAFGFTFEDIYDDQSLGRVDEAFLDQVGGADADLHARLVAARAAPDDLDDKAEADLLLELAPFVDAFTGKLFGIADELGALSGDRKSVV